MERNKKFLPENCFEGKYLSVGKAIYNGSEQELINELQISKIPIDDFGNGGKTGKPTFLMYAVYLENADMIKTLLKLGAKPDRLSLISVEKKKIDLKTGAQIFYYFQNPLNYASGYIKDVSTAKNISGLLIDSGADVNAWGDYYNAPLKNAVILHSGKNSKDMVEFFLSKGADINAHLDKSSGATLLMSVEGEWNLVNYLLEKGADPKILDFTGWDFMWNVDSRLERGSFESNPSLTALRKRLIDEFNMVSPAVQNKSKGDSIRRTEYLKKGWLYGNDGKVIIPEEAKYYDLSREK